MQREGERCGVYRVARSKPPRECYHDCGWYVPSASRGVGAFHVLRIQPEGTHSCPQKAHSHVGQRKQQGQCRLVKCDDG